MIKIKDYQIVSYNKYNTGEFSELTVWIKGSPDINEGDRVDLHGIKGTVSQIYTHNPNQGFISLTLIPDQSNY